MAVLDKYGNRTSPDGFYQKWKVKVIENDFIKGLSCAEDCEAEVTNSGLACFKHLKVAYDGMIELEGKEANIEFCISITNMKGKAIDAAVDAEGGEMSLLIKPRNFLTT